MKKRSLLFIFVLAALVLIGACDINNPVIDEWWVGETPEPRIIVPITSYTVTFDMGEGGTYVDLRPTTDPNYVPPAGPIPPQIVLVDKATVYEPGLVEYKNPTRKYFAGWYTAQNGGGIRWDFNTTKATALLAGDDGKIELYAAWADNGVTVPFYLNPPPGSGMTGADTTYYDPVNNSDGLPLPEYTAAGIELSQPKGFGIDPSNDLSDDYAFTGWYTWTDKDGNGEDDIDNSELTLWDFEDPIPDGLKLYAGWGIKTIGGIIPPVPIVPVVPNDDPIPPPAPDPITIYTVDYDLNGDGVIDDTDNTIKIIENQKIPKPDAVQKDGKLFNGWYKDDNNNGIVDPGENLWDFNTGVTDNITLIPNWVAIPEPPPPPPTPEAPKPDPTSYSIKFNMNGGKYVDLRDPVQVQPEGPIPEQIVMPNSTQVFEPGLVENEGKYFKGWFTAPEGGDPWVFNSTPAKPEYDPEKTGEITLYAQWEDTGHTVTFNPGGDFDRNGKYSPATEINFSDTTYDPRSEYKANGVPISEPKGFGLEPDTAKDDDYAFTGWYVDNDGDGLVGIGDTPWDFTKPLTDDMDDITLYAGWGTKTPVGVDPPGAYQPEIVGPPKPSYTINFESGGADTTPSDEMIISGQKITAPDAIHKKDYVFDGWYTDGEYTEEWDFNTPVAEDYDGSNDDNRITLYAKWEPEPYTPPWFKSNYSLLSPQSTGEIVRNYYPFQVVPGGNDFTEWDDAGGDLDEGAADTANYNNLQELIANLRRHPENIALIVGYEDSPGDPMDTKREITTWWNLYTETDIDPSQLVINTTLPEGYTDGVSDNMLIAPNDSRGIVANGDEIRVYLYQPF